MPITLASDALMILIAVAFVAIPVIAIVDIARHTERWTFGPIFAVTICVLTGPCGSAIVLGLNQGGGWGARRSEARRDAPSPLLPYVGDLEERFDPSVTRDYEARELARYALTRLNDHLAGRALSWLESGLPVTGLAGELRALEVDESRDPSLRERAAKLLGAAA